MAAAAERQRREYHTTTQKDWKAGTYLDNWYNNANTTYASKLAFGLALKGFDSETASWYYPNGRVIAQQCGQVWLNSFAENNGHPNVNFIQVSTWDDYEEGSEFETGIDNCFSTPTLLTRIFDADPRASQDGRDLRDDEHYLQPETVGFAGWNELGAARHAPSGDDDLYKPCQLFGVLTVGQAYQFKIQAVGQPGISNQLSAATNYTR
jgi:hypothetical protein